MTLNNLTSAFFDNDFYVYYLMFFICVLEIVLTIISRFSETKIIKSGIYLFSCCLIINFVLSFYSDAYWIFILHWFLASLIFFIFWYLLIYMSENYGQPYVGDGGMVMILPVYFLFLALISSIIIKGIIGLIHLF